MVKAGKSRGDGDRNCSSVLMVEWYALWEGTNLKEKKRLESMEEEVEVPKSWAPLFIRCQQKDIGKIRDGVPGHGPQRVIAFSSTNHGQQVTLACGCGFLFSWLPAWEAAACKSLSSRIGEKMRKKFQ